MLKSRKVTVLVYEIPEELLRRKQLDLMSRADIWTALTGRMLTGNTIDLTGWWSVKGPLVVNRRNVILASEAPYPLMSHVQYCILDLLMLEELEKYLRGVLYSFQRE